MQTTFRIDFPFKSWKKLFNNFSDESCTYDFIQYRISRLDCRYGFEVIYKETKYRIVALDLKYHKSYDGYEGSGATKEQKFEVWIEIPAPQKTFQLNKTIGIKLFMDKIFQRNIDLTHSKAPQGYQLSGNKDFEQLIPSLEFIKNYSNKSLVFNDYVDPKTVKNYLVFSTREWITDYDKLLKLLFHMDVLIKSYRMIKQ